MFIIRFFWTMLVGMFKHAVTGNWSVADSAVLGVFLGFGLLVIKLLAPFIGMACLLISSLGGDPTLTFVGCVFIVIGISYFGSLIPQVNIREMTQ